MLKGTLNRFFVFRAKSSRFSYDKNVSFYYYGLLMETSFKISGLRIHIYTYIYIEQNRMERNTASRLIANCFTVSAFFTLLI